VRSDHRTPIRCRVRGCPALGLWDPQDPRCPMHRGTEWDPPRIPELEEQWDTDPGQRGR
jgi:hypothetical protein